MFERFGLLSVQPISFWFHDTRNDITISYSIYSASVISVISSLLCQIFQFFHISLSFSCGTEKNLFSMYFPIYHGQVPGGHNAAAFLCVFFCRCMIEKKLQLSLFLLTDIRKHAPKGSFKPGSLNNLTWTVWGGEEAQRYSSVSLSLEKLRKGEKSLQHVKCRSQIPEQYILDFQRKVENLTARFRLNLMKNKGVSYQISVYYYILLYALYMLLLAWHPHNTDMNR